MFRVFDIRNTSPKILEAALNAGYKVDKELTAAAHPLPWIIMYLEENKNKKESTITGGTDGR